MLEIKRNSISFLIYLKQITKQKVYIEHDQSVCSFPTGPRNLIRFNGHRSQFQKSLKKG